MADFEGGEFAGGGADVAALVADVVGEAVANGFEERIGFVAVAFDDEFDAAVGQVADVAGDVVAFLIQGAALGSLFLSARSEESTLPVG